MGRPHGPAGLLRSPHPCAASQGALLWSTTMCRVVTECLHCCPRLLLPGALTKAVRQPPRRREAACAPPHVESWLASAPHPHLPTWVATLTNTGYSALVLHPHTALLHTKRPEHWSKAN